MNKKIMLLALAGVSAAVLALPAIASALTPLHLNPTPAGIKAIDQNTAVPPILSTSGGTTIGCNSFSGSATFNAGGTTGSMDLTFSGECREPELGTKCNSTGEAAGTIKTTTLPFDLATLPNSKPGILVTPSATGSFAHIECAGGLIKYTLAGNGMIGTIENACGETSQEQRISFAETSHGQQEHKTVAGTATEYDLLKGMETAAQTATGKVTFKENIKLECT